MFRPNLPELGPLRHEPRRVRPQAAELAQLISDAQQALADAVDSADPHPQWCVRVAAAHTGIAKAYAQIRRHTDPPTESPEWWALLDAENYHHAKATELLGRSTR